MPEQAPYIRHPASFPSQPRPVRPAAAFARPNLAHPPSCKTCNTVRPREGRSARFPRQRFPPRGRSTQGRIAADATLSPTSMDFYLHNHQTSIPADARSMQSSRSVSSSSVRSKPESGEWDENSSGRFMAVTRQEEMLLAALRKKRAQIRENLVTDLDGDTAQEKNTNGGSRDPTIRRSPSWQSQNQAAPMSRHLVTEHDPRL